MYREGQVRIPSGCAIAAVISREGRRMSGELIAEAMKPMHDRSNGLGGGFAGYGIYPRDEIDRTYINKATGEEEVNTICTNFYYDHEFSESELHMLMDGILFSRNIPSHQREDLIHRLSALGNKYFQSFFMFNILPDLFLVKFLDVINS